MKFNDHDEYLKFSDQIKMMSILRPYEIIIFSKCALSLFTYTCGFMLYENNLC